MKAKEFCEIVGRLMASPSAPFYETAVRKVVEGICAEQGLPFRRDRFGNVLVRWQSARATQPLVLAAHMDHPGFEIVRALGPNRWLARFNGGVPDRYFEPGLRLRLLPGEVLAQIVRRMGEAKEFEVRAARPPKPGAPAPQFAVWELADFKIRRGRIHGRACDDLVGVASILATLIDLKRSGARVDVLGLITRAEEVGFQGALAAADAGTLPRRALVVSLETSKELPPAKMGRGVILRVGDRTSVFDSQGMRFLTEVAADLQAEEKRFQFQRALMFGGTCEATAFQEFGYRSAAVCVALGNYHNCGPRERIAAEFVSVADACSMVALLVATARRMGEFERLTGKLPARLRGFLREAKRRLPATA